MGMSECNCVYEEFCKLVNGGGIFLPKPCAYRKDSTDFVEVVRCKECIHWDSHGDGYGQCRHSRFHIENEIDPTTTRYSFCDKGEKEKGVMENESSAR